VIAFTGRSRHSDKINKEQVAGLTELNAETIASMHALKRDATEMKVALLGGNIRRVAEILGHSWSEKKKTAIGVSNERVEELFDVAVKAVAWGGRVSGTGSGGFLMLMLIPIPKRRRHENHVWASTVVAQAAGLVGRRPSQESR
jgi:D-glycero-alpha-D-manno-heptose-7-phosphate kinase